MKKLKKCGYVSLIFLIFVVGMFWRTKFFLDNPSLWHDECSMAVNIINKNYRELFGALDYLQMAPPFFLVAIKLFIQIFGISDLNLKFIPFFFGVSSFILFYFLAEKVYENKISIALSFALFAINQKMYIYSVSFKRYSCDVFFTTLCLYLVIDLISRKASFKKIVIYSSVFALSIWFSFPAIFSICAGLLVLFLKWFKEKELSIKNCSVLTVPIFLSTLLYLKVYLPQNSGPCTIMYYCWRDSFINKNLSNFGTLLVSNINYLFPSAKALPLLIALVFAGAFIFVRKKPYLGSVLILTLFLDILAGWLRIYPFDDRLTLFLFPIFLIFVCAIFEAVNLKHPLKLIITLILFFLVFYYQFVLASSYLKWRPKNDNGYYTRGMMQEMQKMIKPSDVILIDRMSDSDFIYYSLLYPVKNKIYQQTNDSKDSLLSHMEKHKYYWLLMFFQPSENIEKWVEEHSEDVLFESKQPHKEESLRYIYIK